jgi:hypothetical protein
MRASCDSLLIGSKPWPANRRNPGPCRPGRLCWQSILQVFIPRLQSRPDFVMAMNQCVRTLANRPTKPKYDLFRPIFDLFPQIGLCWPFWKVFVVFLGSNPIFRSSSPREYIEKRDPAIFLSFDKWLLFSTEITRVWLPQQDGVKKFWKI